MRSALSSLAALNMPKNKKPADFSAGFLCVLLLYEKLGSACGMRFGSHMECEQMKDEIYQNPLEDRIVRAITSDPRERFRSLGNFTCTPAQDRLPLCLERR